MSRIGHVEFDRLVRRIETGVGRRPAALRRRTVAWALIGYTGLLAWFLFVLLLAAGFFSALLWADPVGKILCGIAGTVVLVLGSWLSLRLFLVRVGDPSGVAIRRPAAPELFAVLDDIRARLHAAPFHEVLLTPEFNASVAQTPRMGPLGCHRNRLLLGLPLLDALSPEEMRAVLAHEFAHLSREHGRLSHWLYRLRRSWEIQFRRFGTSQSQDQRALRRLIVRYVEWFWPRFNAHAFVLSRANEYEADAAAARIAGAAHVASSLVRLRLLARLMEETLWPELWQLAKSQPAPPGDAFLRLRDGLRQGVPAGKLPRWSDEAFRESPNNNDTHPCLRERLHALVVSPNSGAAIAHAAAPSAAEALLGASLEPLRAELQAFWTKESGPQWRDHHARAAALGQRLSALDHAAPAAAATIETLWDKANALLHLDNNASAEPLLREILAQRADHAPANYQLGRLLLEAGNASGEAFLEQAMASDEECVPAACELLRRRYTQLGHTDRLCDLDKRLDRHEKTRAASASERAEVTAKDRFVPHGLSQTDLHSLLQIFSELPALGRAHLAQKELKHSPGHHLYVLCVRRRRCWYQFSDTEADRELAKQLSQRVQLPGRTLVIPPAGGFRTLARKIARPEHAVWP